MSTCKSPQLHQRPATRDLFLEPQRPLMINILFSDGFVFVPEIENGSDDNSNSDADEEEP
jgi:hypothetical protein